jgi:hypothetical protein
MDQRNIIFIEPNTSDLAALHRALERATADGRHIRFYMEPAESIAVYEPGDKVQAAFDAGWGPAQVVQHRPDHGGVTIKYGRGGKYSTTVSYGSIRTDHRRERPAVLKWKVGEGEWSPGIQSHQPNGGY